MSIRAIAFDPGKTTGYATGECKDGIMAVRADQAQWKHIDLWRQLVVADPDWLVWEKFVFRKSQQHEGIDLYPRELIGVLNLYAQLANQAHEGHVQTCEQMPMKSTGSYYSDRKISDDGLWLPAHPHAMDALRHLLYWWTFGPGYQYNTKGYKAA